MYGLCPLPIISFNIVVFSSLIKKKIDTILWVSTLCNNLWNTFVFYLPFVFSYIFWKEHENSYAWHDTFLFLFFFKSPLSILRYIFFKLPFFPCFIINTFSFTFYVIQSGIYFDNGMLSGSDIFSSHCSVVDTFQVLSSTCYPFTGDLPVTGRALPQL